MPIEIASAKILPRNDVNQMDHQLYYIYILTNKNHTVLYTGITNNLIRRIYEHQRGVGSGFTKRYNVHKLVYYEQTPSREAAIAREKQIKAGLRQKKLDLINERNPDWEDLAAKILRHREETKSHRGDL